MSNWIRPVAAALSHLLFWSCIAAAQPGGVAAAPEAAGPNTASPPERAPVRIEESRPSIYYLPDKQGSLQPVPNFNYQDFVELYKLKNQLERREQPPSYSLQRLSATGTAEAEHAELTIRCSLLVHDEDWVRVPLRLDQGLLQRPAEYKGSGEQFIHYEGEGAGYVCWIRGKPGSRHEITLSMLVPLGVAGDETRLRLAMPRATASELKLWVPMPDATARVPEGTTLLPLAGNKGAGTEFVLVGLGTDFQVAWHKANPQAAETPVVLESSATALVRLDGHSITADATLSVRSYGAPFDRFTVRLPPDAELTAGNPTGYVVTLTEPSARQTDRRGLVEVRLPRKTAGPVEVRLACRRDYEPSKSSLWCELAGFEVPDAARQWGTVAVAVGGEWQVVWGASRDVHQIEQLPDLLRKEDVVAGFEYAAGPYSLLARLVPRQTRVSVDPKYVLLVDHDRIQLEGKLGYTIRGTRVTTVEVAMPGWELDEVGPDNLVAVEGVTVNSGTVSIPVLQLASGSMELQLRAHRTIEAGATSLRIALPEPRGTTVSPVSLAVAPADNVELTPNAELTEGLARQRSIPSLKLPDRQQTPMYYHGSGGAAALVADFRVHAREMSVEVATHVTLAEQTVAVEQKLSYTVTYEPVDRLTLIVPQALAAAKRIRVFYDGRPLVPVAMAPDSGAADAVSPVSMRLNLPEPHIGVLELVVQYSVPVAAPKADQPSTLSVPLTMPAEGELTSNVVIVKAAGNMRVSQQGQLWTIVGPETPRAADHAALQLSAARRTDHASLELRRETSQTAEASVAERVWIQSWLTSSTRQDRAVYLITTNQKELVLRLPDGAAVGADDVVVDGHQVECRSVDESQLLIPLPGEGEHRHCLVELRYHFLEPRPSRGAMSLQFPQLGSDVWLRRMYWQVVLPANEHLISEPAGMTSEHVWDWRGLFWGRRPLLDQTQLESWSGATQRASLPERTNCYLFSTLDNVTQAELYTASRTWIVLWASGVALVAGLLLIYVPRSRHPAALLVVGVALLAAGLIAPEPTLLLAQGASLGLALTLLAGLLERSVSRRRPPLIGKESPSSLVRAVPRPMPYHPPLSSSQAPTATAPTIQPESLGRTEP